MNFVRFGERGIPMIILKVTNIKAFMNRLLLQPVFDDWEFQGAEIAALTQYSVAGTINPRYLTDEEVKGLSLQVVCYAKNEIYARHGRKFVTPRIADYFNSKSWYKGTEDPETFDNNQGYIFNEYEVANISKIADTEEQRRSEGE